MSYTVHRSPEIDAKIDADLRHVVARVLALLGESQVEAILLTGGFGRGEGSVFHDAGGIRIVNDYDLAILPRVRGRLAFLRYYRRHHRALEALATELAAKLRVKQVDLTLRPWEYFTSPPALRVENFEVKTGHRLLHGTRDPCAAMPAWHAEDLPAFDGTWLFRNRGFGLLMARLYLWERSEPAEADGENFQIECNKAALAMGDAWLLSRRSYRTHYAERLSLAREEISRGTPETAFLRRYIEALEWKLRPDLGQLRVPDALRRWQELATEFQRFFLRFEAQRLSCEFPDWLSYAEARRPETKLAWRTFAGALLRTGHWNRARLKANPGANVVLIGLLLAAELQPDAAARERSRALKMLGLQESGNAARDWLAAVCETFSVIHPGGEVARLLVRFSSSAHG